MIRNLMNIFFYILDPPEVSCQDDQVQGGGGESVVLGCLVHGEPSPTVNWFRWSISDKINQTMNIYRDGQLLDTSSQRYRMEWNLDKRTHSLVIKK